MEQKLTAASRARRRLTAGTKPKLAPGEYPTALEALHKLVTYADKAHGVLREEGLDISAMQVWLLFKNAEEDTLVRKLLPEPGRAATFLADVEALGDKVSFLGILSILEEREAEGVRYLDWITPLTGGVEDLMYLTAARNQYAKGTSQKGAAAIGCT